MRCRGNVNFRHAHELRLLRPRFKLDLIEIAVAREERVVGRTTFSCPECAIQNLPHLHMPPLAIVRRRHLPGIELPGDRIEACMSGPPEGTE
jgi:hypothetical protein